MLDRLVGELQRALVLRSGNYVERFEVTLREIVSLRDPDCIGKLLLFLDDNAEHDEMMFTIVHAIETFDDNIFAREILSHLKAFYQTSPRWAMIVHMRILNSPSTLVAYQQILKTLPDDQKQRVRDLVTELVKKNTRFQAASNKLLTSI